MAPVENHLIELLPRRDHQRLLAICEPVELSLAEVLCEPGKPTRHGYFPVESFISLVALVEGCPGVEVGMVGREGMLGAQLVMGVDRSGLETAACSCYAADRKTYTQLLH